MQAHRDMHDTLTFPAQFETEASDRMGENDGARAEQWSGPERRKPSAWNDPKFWVAFCGVLLTICGLLLTVTLWLLSGAIEKLKGIDQRITEQVTAQQATREMFIGITTQQTAEIKQLRADVDKLDNAMTTQTKAYNYNFTTRLARVEAKAGISTKDME